MLNWCLLSILLLNQPVSPEEKPATKALADALIFHAPFDKSLDAAYALGDGKLYSAKSGKALTGKPGFEAPHVKHEKKKGRFGGSLNYVKKGKPLLYFNGGKNVGYKKKAFSGTVSLWLSLDPGKDLEPGYVDPIQITDKKWNDASFFVDFTDKNPRDFRLGAFCDFKVWNPKNTKWDQIKVSERPMVSAKKMTFKKGHWTHVVYTFENFNTDAKKAKASLYIDGKLQGTLEGRDQKYTWDIKKVSIQLGINYVGGLDDVAIFNQALSGKEVETLFKLKNGVSELSAKKKR